MSNAAKKIMVRVIKHRLEAGEEIAGILEGYTKLTDDEKEELKEAVA